MHLNQTQTMIVPYHNCLVVGYSKNRIDASEQFLKNIYNYFEEYFSDHRNQTNQTDIRIICRNSNARAILQEQMRNMLLALMSQMNEILTQVNGRFSAKEEIKLIFNALNSIKVTGSANQKQPANLQNLNLLKQYYKKFKSQREMKQFLKNLLIQELSLEKKTIKYRKSQQIETLLRIMAGEVVGEISILNSTPKSSQQQKTCFKDKCVIWVLLMDRIDMQALNITQILQRLEVDYKIDRSINPAITKQITMNLVNQFCKNKLGKLTLMYYQSVKVKYVSQLKSFRNNLKIMGILKLLVKLGSKLMQQQRVLNEEFLKFVAEMREKYSGMLARYLKGLSVQKDYKEKHTRFEQQKAKRNKIGQYIHSFSQINKYKVLKINKTFQFCSIIQRRIKSFLITKSAQKNILDSFISCKNKEFATQKIHYQQIRQLYNGYQLQKLTTANKFKYGFSCATHILRLNNFSCYEGFSPQNLLLFIQKINKFQELLVKIKCSQSCIQATTIEGKIYSMGYNNSTPFECNRGKQNVSTYNNSQCLYSKSISNFNSKSSEPSFVDKLSRRQSKSASQWNTLSVTKNQANTNNLINTELNYELKLDKSGKLFGRGVNTKGQLGLGEVKYASNFTCILSQFKIKHFSTLNQHTVLITTQNKVFYFGRGKGKLAPSKIPSQIALKDRIIIKQVLCTLSDSLFLTDHQKVYSLNEMNYLLIPKPLELQFDHFQLVRTGTYNLQIVYLLAYWTNTLDKVQHQQISKYLISNYETYKCESDSLLVDDLPEHLADTNRNNIAELSAILQSPLE